MSISFRFCLRSRRIRTRSFILIILLRRMLCFKLIEIVRFLRLLISKLIIDRVVS